jgi:nicotinate-nucleotide adenylyltransferase
VTHPTILFGGTFDPPHRMHVAMASAAADALGAERILVVPAAVNPQRVIAPPAAAEHRLAMARLAFASEPRAAILDLEIRREGPSYTIDTLRALLHPEGPCVPGTAAPTPLRLLIGSDQARNLGSWRAWREVLALAEPAIVLRPPDTLGELPATLAASLGESEAVWRGRMLPIAPIDLAATTLRSDLARGIAPTDLDPAVLAYIRRAGLYRDGTGPQTPPPPPPR